MRYSGLPEKGFSPIAAFANALCRDGEGRKVEVNFRKSSLNPVVIASECT